MRARRQCLTQLLRHRTQPAHRTDVAHSGIVFFYGVMVDALHGRSQVKFASADWLAELKAAIQGDVDVGSAALDQAPWEAFSRDRLFAAP